MFFRLSKQEEQKFRNLQLKLPQEEEVVKVFETVYQAAQRDAKDYSKTLKGVSSKDELCAFYAAVMKASYKL